MKILVTGASGFIGSNIFKVLLGDENNEVHTISRSNIKNCGQNHIHRKVDLLNRLELGHFDLVYHCAANPLAKQSSDDYNSVITRNLINGHTSDTFIHLSSAHVYGDGTNESCRPKPKTMYGQNKLNCEYEVNKHDNAKIFRLGPIVGKGITHGLLYDIMTNINKSMILQGVFPGVKRSYLHISDLIYYLHNYSYLDKITNIGNIDHIHNYEVYGIIANKLQMYTNVKFNNDNMNNFDLILDSTSLYHRLGFPILSSRQALEKAVDENRHLSQ